MSLNPNTISVFIIAIEIPVHVFTANIADPDQMLHSAVSDLYLPSLQNTLLEVFQLKLVKSNF